jgi:hypothetical protein
MAKGLVHIEVEGLKELQRDIKQREGKLPAALGQAHKRVGAFVIGKLPEGNPNAVGAGSGADIRPSATKRDVIIRAGHAGREGKKDQWGKIPVQPFESGRPYIVGAIEENEDAISEMFLDELMDALSPAFYSASKD